MPDAQAAAGEVVQSAAAPAQFPAVLGLLGDASHGQDPVEVGQHAEPDSSPGEAVSLDAVECVMEKSRHGDVWGGASCALPIVVDEQHSVCCKGQVDVIDLGLGCYSGGFPMAEPVIPWWFRNVMRTVDCES
jgi:hypothetical protein